MFDFIKKIFSSAPSVDYQELLAKGAVLLDVRTSSEFKSGSVKGAINIPLDQLGNKLKMLKKNTPIITCCASGMRSGSATRLLKSKGFDEVYNAGSFRNLL
ncbi:Rhodanese-related sulfurtransferase [Spirosomataceae bacterium TFI 002]|nr:Rhodanese-related sulfurtransferase [Spirosomataceae bacterium TFI 002]